MTEKTSQPLRQEGMKKDNAMNNWYWLFGTRLSVLADQANTVGRYDLIEGWFPPGTQTPPHRHGAYAEQLYVLDGQFTVWAEGRKAVLRPGDDFLIAAGTAHVVAATSDRPGRALVVASPSGFARLITETGTPDEGDGAPPSMATDMDLFLRICAELGDEILGPPGALPDSVEIQTAGAGDRAGSQCNNSDRRNNQRCLPKKNYNQVAIKMAKASINRKGAT